MQSPPSLHFVMVPRSCRVEPADTAVQRDDFSGETLIYCTHLVLIALLDCGASCPGTANSLLYFKSLGSKTLLWPRFLEMFVIFKTVIRGFIAHYELCDPLIYTLFQTLNHFIDQFKLNLNQMY